MRRSLALAVLTFPIFVSAQTASMVLPSDITAEATAASGAIVNYQVTGSSTGDDFNGRPTGTANVTCAPSSGSRFPLGETTVNCTAADANSTVSGSFKVKVLDRTAPSLHLPASISLSAPGTVNYQVSASDLVDAHPSITCTPASGSHFDTGTTTVLCTARDAHNNQASGAFNVTVAAQPDPQTGPPPKLPGDITKEATGPSGATVTYSVTNTGGPEDMDGRPTTNVTCAPASGSIFPLGATTVTCTANGQPAGSFNVTVVDTTAPTLHLPRNFTVQTQDSSAAVTFSASAKDLVDGDVSAVCTPSSGATLPLGDTTVQCTATDSRGNGASGSFVVSVVNTPPPPPPDLPDNMTVEAEGPDGAIVNYLTSGGGPEDADDFNGRPGGGLDCAPASGSLFPLGSTTVDCGTAGTFVITVVDTTAPDLTVPGDITANATSSSGAVVTFDAVATDIVDGNVDVTCTPASGATFAIGTTAVNCTATDAAGNTSNGAFNVIVNDASNVFEIAVSASPDILWPPDHKMVSVTLTVTATNNATIASAQITEITSNEADDGTTSPDWVITGPLSADLRAEKNDQAATREYRIVVKAVDANGTEAFGSVKIIVGNPSALERPDDVEVHDPKEDTGTSQPPPGGIAGASRTRRQ